MKIYKIKNLINGLEFEVTKEGDLVMHPEYGLPERPELDEMGQPTGAMLPSEYVIEVKDITSEVEAEKQAKEVKRLAKEKRKTDRKSIDWNKVNSIAELKAIVKSLVEEVEND